VTAALFVVGAVLVVAFAAVVWWPAALLVAGLFALGAAVVLDLADRPRAAQAAQERPQ
jgi:hypothetical protein